MTKLTTFDPALAAIQSALEPKRIDKRQLLNSMQRMDHEMRLRHYPAVMDAEPVYARVSEDECDAAFDAETQQAYFGTDRR